jgi:hypothetical protein
MTDHAKPLGIMRPLGGGDPIPLKKPELLVGRRPTCDIHLDYERVSGKHCQLRFIAGVWHVRDLNSTNGTTKNGQRISSEHDLLPDDELGIAGHLYMIDYDPVAPTQVMAANHVLEEEFTDTRRHRSLMELAGLESERSANRRPERAPERIVRPAAADAEFDDALAENMPDAVLPKVAATDEDFFKMIQEDVKENRKKRKP